MSSWSDLADKIRLRLKSLVLMENVAVIVDKQKDLENTVTQAIDKLGGAVVVSWKDGTMINKQSSDVEFYISFFGAPILLPDNAPPVAELVQAALVALHNWKPSSISHCFDEVEVVGPAIPIQHQTYACARFPVRVRARISTPEFLPDTP